MPGLRVPKTLGTTGFSEMSRDRRQHERIDVSKLGVTLRDAGGEGELATVLDISIGGMCVRSHEPMAPGASLQACLASGGVLSTPFNAVCRGVDDDGRTHLSIRNPDLKFRQMIRRLANRSSAGRPVAP